MLDRIAAKLSRAFRRPEPSRAAQHWDEWQKNRNALAANYVDWGDHPTLLGLVYQELFGSSTTTFLDYLKAEYPSFGQSHALSLCSGDGGFEKLLVAQGVFRSVLGTDLSPVRVEQANNSRGQYADRLEYQLADVNKGDFGTDTYDVVFAKAALHHVEDLERLFRGIRQCLRPGGRLVTLDFFGATRFQWTDRQLSCVNRFLNDSVPEAPLLNLIFDGSVVNNFEAGNPAHDKLIERAFRYERELMAKGEIGSDFKFIIAR